MYIENKFDKTIKRLPLLFAFLIFMFEGDNKARLLIASSLFIMFFVNTLVREKEKREVTKQRTPIIYRVIESSMVFVLVILSYFDNFYFFVGFVSIPIIIYKIFEFLGDLLEHLLHHKLDMSRSFAVYLKFCLWIVGSLIFLFCFLGFIFWFVTLFPQHYITSILYKFDVNTVKLICALILSLISAIFIIDFLRKMLSSSFNTLNLNELSRFQVQTMFIKVIGIIIFTDIVYALLYLSFSDIGNVEFKSYFDLLPLFKYYLKSIYYAFCLHFAVPMPTTAFIVEMDKTVKQMPYLQIIQFFHFCFNKVVDITILVSAANSILNALRIRQSER